MQTHTQYKGYVGHFLLDVQQVPPSLSNRRKKHQIPLAWVSFSAFDRLKQYLDAVIGKTAVCAYYRAVVGQGCCNNEAIRRIFVYVWQSGCSHDKLRVQIYHINPVMAYKTLPPLFGGHRKQEFSISITKIAAPGDFHRFGCRAGKTVYGARGRSPANFLIRGCGRPGNPAGMLGRLMCRP